MATEKEKFMKKKLNGGGDSEYEMDRDEAIAEHVRLIRILRSGSKAEQLREAALQERELEKIRKGEEDD